MSLWDWIRQSDSSDCLVRDIPSHQLRIAVAIEATDQGYCAVAYPPKTPEILFLQVSGSTPQEAAQKLQEHLLERLPDLRNIFFPVGKSALERLLSEDWV